MLDGAAFNTLNCVFLKEDVCSKIAYVAWAHAGLSGEYYSLSNVGFNLQLNSSCRLHFGMPSFSSWKKERD